MKLTLIWLLEYGAYPPASDIVRYIISPPPEVPKIWDGKRKQSDSESRRPSKKRKLVASIENAVPPQVEGQIEPSTLASASSEPVTSAEPLLDPTIQCFPKSFIVTDLPTPLPPGLKSEPAAALHRIPYFQYRGRGPPSAQLGSPGDLYIDCIPEYRLFIRKETDWVQWPGMGLSFSRQISHSFFPQQVIYAGPYDLGWYSWSTVVLFQESVLTPHQCINRILFPDNVSSESNTDHSGSVMADSSPSASAITLDSPRQTSNRRETNNINRPSRHYQPINPRGYDDTSTSPLRHYRKREPKPSSVSYQVFEALAADNAKLRLELQLSRDENAKLREAIKSTFGKDSINETPVPDTNPGHDALEVASSAVIIDPTTLVSTLHLFFSVID